MLRNAVLLILVNVVVVFTYLVMKMMSKNNFSKNLDFYHGHGTTVYGKKL
jgi:hypothetical protein